MSGKGAIDIRKIIAFILLVLDVLAIIYLGYAVGENRALHNYGNGFIGKPDEDVFLTINKDIETTYLDEPVLIPKGSVVMAYSIHRDQAGVYFSKTNPDFRELKKNRGSSLNVDDPELEVISIHLTNDCFEEKAELDRMNEESRQRTEAYRKQAITNALFVFVGIGLCWFLIGTLLIFILSKKEMYVLIYVIEILFVLIVFFVCPSFLLVH